MKLPLPEADLHEFSRLPEAVQAEVNEWRRLLGPLFQSGGCGCKIGKALERVAARIDCSATHARHMYDLWKRGGVKGGGKGIHYQPGDWRVFINRSKKPARGESIPTEIVEAFKTVAEQNQRKTRPAHRKFMRAWRSGELRHLPWPEVDPRRGHPIGCSYNNLRRKLNAFELAAMRQGLGEALADHGAQCLTTRAGLWVGSHLSIDDVLRDFRVALLSNTGKIARIQELGVFDIFSADRAMVHRRPQYERADGVKDSVKEREMRFTIAAWFRNIGFSPRGTVMITELGTAAIRNRLAAFLHEHSSGKISRREAGITGKEQIIGGYYGRGGGNPRHKPGHEATHNLIHNEAADLPAATGHDRNYPEWLHGQECITGQVLKWLMTLPPEQAVNLRLPVCEYWQALALLEAIDHRIAWRTDHNLEGWEQLRHTTMEWRTSLLDDTWISSAEFLSLPDHQQRELDKAAEFMPALRRARKLSPREVFAAGARDLVKFPDHVIALMFCDRDLGDDLRVTKSITADGAFHFTDVHFFPEPGIRFDARRLTAPDGAELRLDPKLKYGTVLNPWDSAILWVYGPRGEYLGAAPLIGRVCRLDEGATKLRLGQISHDHAQLTAPLKERHADAIRMVEDLQEHNQRVVEGEPVTPEAITQARRESRLEAKAAAAGAALRSLAPPAHQNRQSPEEEIEIRHI